MYTAINHLFSNWTQDTHLLEQVTWHILLTAIVYVVSVIFIKLFNRAIARILHVRKHIDERRRQTLESLLTNVVRYSIYFVLVLTILPLFGVRIAALLAGAGVAGLAISFGAQNLIKDFFTGFFILFEDQYGVGDWVQINGITGKVVLVSPRVTAIQQWTGEIAYFPNGSISMVINNSKSPSLALVSFNVSYRTDSEEALRILDEVLHEVVKEDPNALGDIQILGVNTLNQSDYTIRATLVCKPYSQFSVQRLAYRKLQKRFTDGLQPPFQNIVYIDAFRNKEVGAEKE